jgi:hypothetical protein
MVASVANRTLKLDYEEAEQVTDDIVRAFINEKVYFAERWKDLGAGKVCSI